MTALINLVAATGHQNTAPPRFPVRPLTPDDLSELARLHRHVYASDAAQQQVKSLVWSGTPASASRPRTIETASLVATGPDGQITAAIIITERDGEVVIDELFTHPDHRRQGLAEELLRHCMRALHTLGRTTVAVAVDENTPRRWHCTSPETSAASRTMTRTPTMTENWCL